MTACRLQHGWCYLAVVLDLASRRVLGWAVRPTPAPDLAIAALTPALARVPQRAKLLHHSDRGLPYASNRFRALLTRYRITPSMSRTGDCWDNAPVESFFSSFKAEASPDHPWSDLDAATTAIHAYIDFYNQRRLHSTLDYQSPVAFEARMARAV
jgi:transposase InsO family protein